VEDGMKKNSMILNLNLVYKIIKWAGIFNSISISFRSQRANFD